MTFKYPEESLLAPCRTNFSLIVSKYSMSCSMLSCILKYENVSRIRLEKNLLSLDSILDLNRLSPHFGMPSVDEVRDLNVSNYFETPEDQPLSCPVSFCLHQANSKSSGLSSIFQPKMSIQKVCRHYQVF